MDFIFSLVKIIFLGFFGLIGVVNGGIEQFSQTIVED
jgi:hypothetical protein